MIDIQQNLVRTLLWQDIAAGATKGVNLKVGPSVVHEPLSEAEIEELETNHGNKLCPALRDFYLQCKDLQVGWEIFEKLGDERSSEKIFQNDPWLIQEFLEQSYDWGVVKEMLSGYINILPLKDLLSPHFAREQGYAYVLEAMGKDPLGYVPLALHWSLTAVLPKVNNEILDEVHLVNSEGQSIDNLKIGVAEFVELSYQTKGFHHWPLVALYKKKTIHFELMQRFLPILFPDVEMKLERLGL